MIVQDKLEHTDKAVIRLVIVLWALLLLCTLISSDLFILAYLGLGIVSTLLLPMEQVILMLAATVSFTNIVSLSVNFSVSLSWILTLAFIFRALIKPFKLKISSLVLCMLFCIYMASGLDSGKAGFFSDIKTIINYMFIIFLAINIEKIRPIKLLDFYIFGHILSVILYFPASRSDRFVNALQRDFTETSMISTLRFTGLDFDSNFFAANCAFIIAVLLIIMSNSERVKCSPNRIRSFLIIYFILGMFSFSKTFVVDVAVLLLLYFVVNISRRFSKLLVAIVLLVVAACVIDEFTDGMVFKIMLSRFVERGWDLNMQTTGRLNIWIAYLEDWRSSLRNIWLGVGMANKRLPFQKMHHQTYIEILYQFGIIGSLIFFTYMGSIFGEISRSRSTVKLHLRHLALISIAVCGLTLGQFAFDSFIYQLVIAMILICGGVDTAMVPDRVSIP